MSNDFNSSGSKYLRDIHTIDGKVDVYAVLDAFAVTCPARQHAAKKILCTGIRGKGDVLQDLNEARDAIERAIQMEAARGAVSSVAAAIEEVRVDAAKRDICPTCLDHNKPCTGLFLTPSGSCLHHRPKESLCKTCELTACAFRQTIHLSCNMYKTSQPALSLCTSCAVTACVAKADRKMVEECAGYHRKFEDGLCATCRKTRPECGNATVGGTVTYCIRHSPAAQPPQREGK